MIPLRSLIRPYIQSLHLPGGTKVEFRSELKDKAFEVGVTEEQMPEDDRVAKITDSIWHHDANLTLASIRVEIERKVLAMLDIIEHVPDEHGVTIMASVRNRGIRFAMGRLAKSRHLTNEQVAFLRDLMPILTGAVHGVLELLEDIQRISCCAEQALHLFLQFADLIIQMVGFRGPCQGRFLSIGAVQSTETTRDASRSSRRRLNPVEIAVNKELKRNRWMIIWPAGDAGIKPTETKPQKINSIENRVDHPDWMFLGNIIFKAFRKQSDLAAVLTFDR
jgi:hypothetical protein